MKRVVVVGASLAGARAADALRRLGFSGRIDVVGAELYPPYERPALSKQVLSGTWGFERIRVDLPDGFEATWHLGRRALSLDVTGRAVELDDGSSLSFDGLVIATGATPRRLKGSDDISGVFTLRTIEDSLSLRQAAQPPCRVVVVGGGFIGCEVASTLRAQGADVAIVDPVPHLMERALGDDFAGFFQNLHASNGVDLRLGVGVDRLEASGGRVAACILSDGTELPCEVAVVGIGVVPETGWLESSDVALDASDRSVVCDATCAVMSPQGTVLAGIVAAGDVARWDHLLFGRAVRVEHWENAATMGPAAARRLLASGDDAAPYVDVPFFWSDQWGKKIQFVGLRQPGDEVHLLEGSPDDGKFLAVYGRDGRLTGALGVGRAARVVAMRHMISERASIDDVGGGAL